ncbi:hypothetical protein K3495_g9279 [Podosphaera aphanis]|nr:hypothetical protein K3495_g9279 [Podosphaera aphanis]
MKPRAKTGFLVGYNSCNIYRILLLDEEVVIGTRDVTFDEARFLTDHYEPTAEDDLIPIINFIMIPPTPEITFDIEEILIRNYEPNSQTNDELNDAEKSPSLNNTENILMKIKLDSMIERNHPKVDMCAINEGNIIVGKRNRKKTEKANNRNQSALVAINSVFVIGKAKPLKKLHQSELPPPPDTWNQLKTHPYSKEFWDAMSIEYNTLVEKETIKLVKQIRICVGGDLQPKKDEDNYASTLAFQVFQVYMAIVAYFSLETLQVDAVNAFCNSPLDEEIYLYNPPGFGRKDNVLRLLRGLYGLRKSPKLWLGLLSGTLSDIGLHQVPEQPCVYTDFRGILIFFFVEDLVFMFPEKRRGDTMQILKKLTDKFEFRVLGELEWFLGVRITRDKVNRKLWLSQQSYIEKLCREYNCYETRSRINTPMINDRMSKIEQQATSDEIKLYQQKVGSLIYASGVKRLDISRAVSYLAEFMTYPSKTHHEAVTHCLFNLYQTRDYSIEYSGPPQIFEIINCSVDAAFANTEEQRSIQGFVFKLCGGPIHWNSSKQAIVTTSSTEAELLSLSNATKELIWMQRLFAGIQFNPHTEIENFNDNMQTIRLLNKEDPIIKTRLKHVDIYQHWLKERVQNKQAKVSWISTNKMVADGMTKSLSRPKHMKFVHLLNLVRISQKQDSIKED